MLNQLQQLQLKSRDELENIANKLGLVVTDTETSDMVAERIALITSQVKPTSNVVGLTGAIYKGDITTRKELMRELQGHMKAGLKVKVDDESWQFTYGLKIDSGTLNQPMKVILRCASALVQPI